MLKMKPKYKLKKNAKISLLLIIIITIVAVISIKLYKDYLYHQTYEYKLLEISYKLEETKILIDKLTDQELENILTREYSANIVKFANEKYFLFKNLDRYIDYQTLHKDLELNKIVALINVGRDVIFYDNPITTDITKEYLLLVNKYHYLVEDYEPADLVKASDWYAYSNHSLNTLAYTAFQELRDAAELENYRIMINSSYRTYKYQSNLWNQYKTNFGTKKADQYAARAGHSEHQSGYAIDVSDYFDVNDKFEDTEAFTWMSNNCYKYGYILRYPKDKEDITGYAYEPWHYRYVGKEVAEKIQQEQITFDEYYAFYLDK